MSTGLIGFVIALVVAAIIVVPLGKALREHPAIFYVAALLASGAYTWALLADVTLTSVRFLTVIFQKAYLASILLAVVMFTGCLDTSSPLRRRLQPIRGYLSILSFILVLGHLATYLPVYLPRLGSLFALKSTVATSLVVAFVLTALYAVLTLTSVRAVRHLMNSRSWKNLQRLSYVMVALVIVHVALVLGRSALASGGTATMTLSAYAIVVTLYAVLRVRKALRDRQAHAKADKPRP